MLGFEFWVLGLGFWVLGFGFWVLGVGFWMGSRVRGQGFGNHLLGRRRMSVAASSLLPIRTLTSISRVRVRVLGFRV